ncbi:MAG: hypothetical protein Q4F12_01660 [Erysipelotrichaceae bacterium]|nr:hypothetical protein [Erysipelotrichaceae bacterium]
MASIAYITDGKLLDNHRLNQNKTMNFWRLSTKTNFTEFGIGGLVFFLSKNKEHLSSKKEKGIVGFGRLVNIYVGSPKIMWDKFNKTNGYNTYDEFLEAICKVSKNHEVPEKLSSLYLENVCFFQAPIYLSELGIEISKNVESYVYIKPDEAVIKLLEYGRTSTDLWSSVDGQDQIIVEEELGAVLSFAHSQSGDIKLSGTKLNKSLNEVHDYLLANPIYKRVNGSQFNMYNVYEDNLTICFYHNKGIDIRTVIGQALLYKRYIEKYYPHDLSILFKTTDNNLEFSELVN